MSKSRITGIGLVGALALVALALFFTAAGSTAESHEEAAPADNHYKCYPILDWDDWEPRVVELKDQFGLSQARVAVPYKVCNPVSKNGEGIADATNHLVCYQIHDKPSGQVERVRELIVNNQFGTMTVWIGIPSRELCLPSGKKDIG